MDNALIFLQYTKTLFSTDKNVLHTLSIFIGLLFTLTFTTNGHHTSSLDLK